MRASYLGRLHVFLLEQRVTEGLLLPLINVGESEHLFSVRRGEVKKGGVHSHKSLVLPSDEQDAVPERIKEQVLCIINLSLLMDIADGEFVM